MVDKDYFLSVHCFTNFPSGGSGDDGGWIGESVNKMLCFSCSSNVEVDPVELMLLLWWCGTLLTLYCICFQLALC